MVVKSKINALYHQPVFFSICTRPFVFSFGTPLGSFHFAFTSFCTVLQNIMKESFTKCVIDGVEGARVSQLPSNWPRTATAKREG